MFQRLINLSLILVLLVIGLGALTRLMDAGLGCPDWPGCYGFLTPPQATEELQAALQAYPESRVVLHQAWMEMIHRYAASSLGLLIIGLVILSPTKALKKISTIILIVVILQGAFGMWTVTLKLWPPVVTLHLLGGFTTLSLLLWLKIQALSETTLNTQLLSSDSKNQSVSSKSLLTHGKLTLSLLVFQITLGAWTSSNYAGLACPDFPTCQNQWLPDISLRKALTIPSYDNQSYLYGRTDAQTRTSIQYLHRVGALILSLILLSLVYRLWRTNLSHAKLLSATLLFFLSTQVLLGILSAILQLPLGIALAHNLCAALLLSNLIIALCFIKQQLRSTLPEISINAILSTSYTQHHKGDLR